MRNAKESTYYDILDVEQTATREEIRDAYRRLVKEYHPDVSNKVGNNEIQKINLAYEVLSDPDMRSRYDEYLSPARVVDIPDFLKNIRTKEKNNNPPAQTPTPADVPSNSSNDTREEVNNQKAPTPSIKPRHNMTHKHTISSNTALCVSIASFAGGFWGYTAWHNNQVTNTCLQIFANANLTTAKDVARVFVSEIPPEKLEQSYSGNFGIPRKNLDSVVFKKPVSECIVFAVEQQILDDPKFNIIIGEKTAAEVSKDQFDPNGTFFKVQKEENLSPSTVFFHQQNQNSQ